MDEIIFKQVNGISGDYISKLFIAVDGENDLSKDKDKLYDAYANSTSVFSAWKGDELIAIARVITDKKIVGIIAGVRVHPDYQGNGIGKTLIEMCLSHYPRYQFTSLLC